MEKHRAYICYRVLARLEQQGRRAADEQRWQDNASIFQLIGGLEYKMFGTCSFAVALQEAA